MMGWGHTLKSLWDPTAALLAAADEDVGTKQPARLRQFQFELDKKLGSPHPGTSVSIFKGHGLDLKNLREYQAGDEIRKIDWNVTARTGIPHVKEHYEEKQVPVWFFVDATMSMAFGQSQSKLAYAGQLISLLGLMAIKAGHRAGLILWQGEARTTVIKPGGGIPQIDWFYRQLQQIEPTSSVDADRAFPDVQALLQNRSMLFLLSDFAFLETLPESRTRLARLSAKHQIESLLLVDRVESQLCWQLGQLPVGSPDGKNTVWVDTTDRWLIREYRQKFQQRLQQRTAFLSPIGPCRIAYTDTPPIDVVAQMVRTSP